MAVKILILLGKLYGLLTELLQGFPVAGHTAELTDQLQAFVQVVVIFFDSGIEMVKASFVVVI